MADLEKMILARKGNAFGGFMNYMEKKYGGDEQDMPDEEAFTKKKKTKRDSEKKSEPGKKKRLTNKK